MTNILPKSLLSGLAVLVAVAGCGRDTGPDLGNVEGYVFLDGQPLSGAVVTFIPENGSTSYGVTDEQGYYTLMYSRDKNGALIGKHQVRISTGQPPDEDDEGNPTPAVPEKVPVEYNQQTTLTAEVKPGNNQIDFKDLKSGGEIQQPKSYDEA